MMYARNDSIYLVAEVDGIKCAAVYTLEWSHSRCQATVRTTFPCQAVADGVFELHDDEEPLDIVPAYVEDVLAEAGNQYAGLARQLTAYTIIVMEHCLEGETDLLDELSHPSFDSISATYESHTKASSR